MSDSEGTGKMRPTVLGHFANYRFTARFWEMEGARRRARARACFEDVRAAADLAHPYLLQGSRRELTCWCGVPCARRRMRRGLATSCAGQRRRAGTGDIVEPVNTLWGYTRPSEYSKARSAQEVDSFAEERRRYLVVYPFTKTADWYLFGRETRQGMMNEHIRIGKQFRRIKQLLLYSFGSRIRSSWLCTRWTICGLFSRLVHELRGTEGRRYTASDAPLHTGILTSPEEWLDTLG